MGEVTVTQYDIVVNVLSLTIALMGVASLFLLLQRNEVLPRYRMAVTLLGLVTGTAAYSYWRLYAAWVESFSVVNGTLRASGVPYNEGLRYVDWVITVPLVLTALVMVLDIPALQARARATVLSILGAEMVLLAYPGQLSSTVEARWLWWGVALAPAVVIVYQLYVGLSVAVASEPLAVRATVRRARLLLVLTGAVYPILYLLPMFGATGGVAFAGMEVAYALTDIVSKAFLGWMLYRVAATKSLPIEEIPVLAGTLRAVKG